MCIIRSRRPLDMHLPGERQVASSIPCWYYCRFILLKCSSVCSSHLSGNSWFTFKALWRARPSKFPILVSTTKNWWLCLQQACIENLPCACNTNKMFSRMVVDVLARNSTAYQVCKSNLKCYSYLTSIDRDKCSEQLWQMQLQLCAMAFFSLLFYSCVHTIVDLRHLSMYSDVLHQYTCRCE
jgi:hypothetical protein